METKGGSFGSNFGFLMTTIGSAVGLGSLWGFSYKMGANGGFAFLFIYLILVITVGFPVMMGEITIGRKTGKGVLTGYRGIGKKYAWMGVLAFIAPFFLSGFCNMLGGYCLHYAVSNLGSIFGASWGANVMESGDLFGSVISNTPVAIG